MVCPNCDTVIRDKEYLVIGPTKSDGFFSVSHFQQAGLLTKPKKICKTGWYNRLSIDLCEVRGYDFLVGT